MKDTFYKTGDVASCNACSEPIQLAATGFWMHTTTTPRHIGMPKPEWDNRYEESDIELLASLAMDIITNLAKLKGRTVPEHRETNIDELMSLVDKYFPKEG